MLADNLTKALAAMDGIPNLSDMTGSGRLRLPGLAPSQPGKLPRLAAQPESR
jgi:hypothetical protein